MTEQNNTKAASDNSGLGEILSTTVLILVLLGGVILLYFGVLRYQAEVYHSRATDYLRGSNLDLAQARRLETKAVNLASFEDRYHRVLSRLYLSRLNRVMNNEKLNQQQRRSGLQNLIARAVNQAQTATQISSHNATNWSNLASVYQSLMNYAVKGAADQALKNYTKAIELAPTDPSLYTELAWVHLAQAGNLGQKKKEQNKQHLEQAENRLSKALELKPDYWPALFQRVVLYDRQGETEKAYVQLKRMAQARPQDQSVPFQLGVMYWRDEELSKAREQFQRALGINSKFANARYFLGLVYDKQGQKQKAIKQFEKIASLSEENEQRVANILKRLRAGKSALKEAQTSQQPQQIPELEGEENSTTTAPQQ